MCFGMTTTQQTNTTSTPNANVASAANQNLDFAKNLQTQGFNAYGGQQVANFSPDQLASFNMTNSVANNGTAPQATNLINNYAQAPASSVNANSIASQMTPYMNQYVMQALAPQLQQMDISNAATNHATDAQATGSGAYGDARTGIQQANNGFLQNVQREGVIGNAYNNAFNTAIGAGAQDVSNNLNAQTTNAGLREQALNRSLGGANALEGLQNQQLGVAGAQNATGSQQTAQQQANLTAQYNQWLMAQQYPFQTAQLLNQTTAAGANAMPASTQSTTQQPNNSGLALLGTLGGAALGTAFGMPGIGAGVGSAMFGGGFPGSPIGGAVGPTSYGGVNGPMPLTYSDRRLKEDIDEVGKLNDGTPVYSYRYKGTTRKHIGVMAQDVEETMPEAVQELWPGGPKAVNYDMVAARSRIMNIAV